MVVAERQWDDLFSDEDRAAAAKGLRQTGGSHPTRSPASTPV